MKPSLPLLAAFALAAAAIAQPPSTQPAAADPPAIAPQADEVLKQMGASLGKATQLSFQAHTLMDQPRDDGQTIKVALTQKATVRRPDRIHVLAEGDLVHAEYWYDGRTLAMLDRADNTYATAAVPPTIDAMFDHVATEFGVTMPLCDLLFADPCAAVRPRIRSGDYLGLHTVRGVQCHHLAFRQEAVDWQIWIQADPPAVPRLLVITYKELPGDPQFLAWLDEWNLAAEAPDALFRFEPPPGGRQVELTARSARPPAGSETKARRVP
jgi:hypothetical protein